VEIKDLASEINKVHAKLLQEVYTTSDLFEDQLELHAVGLDNIFRERNFEGRGFIRVKSADGGVMRTPSAKVAGLTKAASSKMGLPNTGSFKEKQPSGLLSFFKGSSSTEQTVSPELAKIEEDIANIRASIRVYQNKKSLTEREQLILEDFQMKLRLRMSQRDRLTRETFHITTPSPTTHPNQATEDDTEVDGSKPKPKPKGSQKDSESED